MSAYQSRFLPRRQTVALGKIHSGDRYALYYDVARDALEQGQFPHVTLVAGRLLIRASKAQYDALASRTIPPGSARNMNNRLSGGRPHGVPGIGALYLGTVAGVLREHAHYANLPKGASPLQVGGGHGPLIHASAPDVTRAYIAGQKMGAGAGGQCFHVYRLVRTIQLADLRITSLAPFFLQLSRSGAARQRYGIATHAPWEFLTSAASDTQDYSAARGMSDAVADMANTTGDDGVCAFSSRADRDDGLVLESHGDPTGGLIVALFGHDGHPVNALAPAGPLAGYPTFADLAAALP